MKEDWRHLAECECCPDKHPHLEERQDLVCALFSSALLSVEMSSVDVTAAPLVMLCGGTGLRSPGSGLQSSSQILEREMPLIQFDSLQPFGPNPKRFCRACAVN